MVDIGQVASHAEAVVAAATAGRWPAAELAALLGYVKADVLRQAADEEALLFPGRGEPGISRLVRDHARLRAAVEVLDRAAPGDDSSAARLACAIRDFRCQLEDHVAAEAAVLARTPVS